MKKHSLADKLITGFLLILGMAETGHLVMVFGHRPFSDAVICFAAEAAIFTIAGCGISIGKRLHTPDGVRTGRKTARARSAKRRAGSRGLTGKDITPMLAGIGLVFMLLALFQIVTVGFGESVKPDGDQTIETVQSILETEEIYAVNPLTGRPYTAGIPTRIRILGLPTFYAILCRIAGMVAQDGLRGGSLCVVLITQWIPVIVLCLTYVAYWSIATALFPEEKDREKRLLFMAFVAAVFYVGNTCFGLDGFGLLYCGYRGITIRNCILVPYTLGLMLRNRWRHAMLCVVAEACIVWTLYGMGACAAVAAGMALLQLWQNRRRGNLAVTGRRSGS